MATLAKRADSKPWKWKRPLNKERGIRAWVKSCDTY